MFQHGRSLHMHEYGPFTVAMPEGLSTASLADDPTGEPWTRVGLVVDPGTYRHDRQQVSRHIEAFLALIALKTADEILLDPDQLAGQVLDESGPTVLPLWEELEAYGQPGDPTFD